jgi:hypothetical protein
MTTLLLCLGSGAVGLGLGALTALLFLSTAVARANRHAHRALTELSGLALLCGADAKRVQSIVDDWSAQS